MLLLKTLSKTAVFFAVSLLDLYRLTLSGRVPACRFSPTCSAYSREAFLTFGFFKGLVLSAKRLARCHPWGAHGFDPVVGRKN